MNTKATEIATQAFELADSGKLPEAVPLYRQALGLADSQSDDLERMHSEFASVLSRLGDFEAALDQRRLGVEAALDQYNAQDSSAVVIARHFLGDLLLVMGRPEEALSAIQPSLGPSDLEWTLRIIEARAHHGKGRVHEAMVAARRAIEGAGSEVSRERIRDQLAEILNAQIG